MNAKYEMLYFAIANVFFFAIFIGVIWTFVEALSPHGQRSIGQRVAESFQEHALLLVGLTFAVLASYVVYLQFYPDTYECDLTDGSVVIVSIDQDKAWIEIGDKILPAANVVECRPLVTSLTERIERAFRNLEAE